jgi:N,N-dimethylformamidase
VDLPGRVLVAVAVPPIIGMPMLDAAWALDNLSLVAEYRRHLNEGAAAAPASGELLRLVQLLQWQPRGGAPCVFGAATWWHTVPAPRLEHAYYVALLDSRRGVPLQVCTGCGHRTFAAAAMEVFRLRWEAYTGRALPSAEAIEAGASGAALPPAPLPPEAEAYTVERKLLGYALDASASAGGTATFCVSSELPAPITATFERLLCWDSDPGGPGLQTVAVDPPRTLAARHQLVVAGSCGLVDVPAGAALAADSGEFTLVATVFPTAARKLDEQEGVMTYFADDAPQAILCAEFAGAAVCLGLSATGLLQLLVDGRAVAESERPLLSRQWCTVGVSCAQAADGSAVFSLLAAPSPSAWSADARPPGTLTTATVSAPPQLGALRGVSVAVARANGALSDFYNGRIAGPTVYGVGKDLGLLLAEHEGRRQGVAAVQETQLPAAAWFRTCLSGCGLFGCWDLSQEIPTTRMVDTGPHGLHGALKNTPTRGVKGPGWSGRTQVWTVDTAEEYDAVHFHEDDMTDCSWSPDLELALPADLPSGVYALHLEQEGEHPGERWQDYIPIFVRPARPQSSLCYLMPTVSMQCYEMMEGAANSRNADGSGAFGGTTAMLSMPATTAFMRQLPASRCFGRSTYDFHNDGDGVKYASMLRPGLNSRPCETAWQFCAEAHVASFLDARGISYDIVTDHQLHAEGLAALAPYRAVLSGTHPEYYSKPMLDALMTWTHAGGGRLISLGANGYYWHCAFPDEGDPRGLSIAEMRRSEGGSRAWLCEPGEYYASFTSELQGMWRRLGRPPQMLTGCGFSAQGFDLSIPYTRLEDSNDPRADFVFEGVGVGVGGCFGDHGLVFGGAAGSEIDRADESLGTPRHALRLATAAEFPASYHHVTEEQFHAHSASTGLTNELVRADMLFFETPGGGAVWSTGSIAWGGALPTNGFDNDVARITENVIRRFVGAAPFAEPAGADARAAQARI